MAAQTQRRNARGPWTVCHDVQEYAVTWYGERVFRTLVEYRVRQVGKTKNEGEK